MFRSVGFFANLKCPEDDCRLPGCLYKHVRTYVAFRPLKRRKLESSPAAEHGNAFITTAQDVNMGNSTSHTRSLLKRSRIVQSLLPSTNDARLSDSLSHAEKKLRDVKDQAALAQKTTTGLDKVSQSTTEGASKTSLNRDATDIHVESKPQGPNAPADPRYVSRATVTPEITLRFDPVCKVPHESRLHYLRLYKTHFERIYAPLSADQNLFQDLVTKHALSQEQEVLAKNGKGTYKQGSRNVLIKLNKREPAKSSTDIGIHPHYQPPLKCVTDWSSLVHSTSTLEKWGYTVHIPAPDATMKNEEGCDRVCERCTQRFVVSADPDMWLTCTHHPGKSSFINEGGSRTTKWTCCTTTGAGCVTSPSHVFKVSHAPRLAAYHGYHHLTASDSQHPGAELDAVALDCEMVYTTASMELARISITSKTGELLLDEYVAPENAILDLNTRYSGILQANLDSRQITREALATKMMELGISKDTILIGHGLENDLTALRLVHERVIDSAILFPHPRGRPYRNALKYLAKRFLNKDIQMNPVSGDGSLGHDPAEDARSALELVLWKATNGDKTVGDQPFSGKLK